MDELDELLQREAERREQAHASDPDSRPLSKDYELIGLIGEAEFARTYRQPLDLSGRSRGDGGIDFMVPLAYTVDVKTFRNPLHLIEKQGRIVADIYVLADYSDKTRKATLLKWEWGRVLRQAPVRDFGHGILNHYIACERLRPMSELTHRIMRLIRTNQDE